jgi:hypothetical protein
MTLRMYHYKLGSARQKFAALASAAASFLCLNTSIAADSDHMTSRTDSLKGNLSFASQDFQLPPHLHALLKKKPINVTIYQYDSKPLGERNPLLLVHGLRGEYLPFFRWKQVIDKLSANTDFTKTYKIYLARYDSTTDLRQTLPQFKQALMQLFAASQYKPLTLIALSIGGNLSYESILDSRVNDAVNLIITLGTPFHGSPLFSEDWLQYSVYRTQPMPWNRLSHSLAYRIYFARNTSLLTDFAWDNVDGSIPNVGRFRSLVPFGPHGDLSVDQDLNTQLAQINTIGTGKKKLITYGGYLANRYTQTVQNNNNRKSQTANQETQKAVHVAIEHPVLRLLNGDISRIVVAPDVVTQTSNAFIYQLNDGITPVTSALFLPNEVCTTHFIANDSDIAQLRGLTDVKRARVFQNIDHLTYVDGFRPHHASKLIQDRLNPEEPSRQMFDWMLTDLLQPDNHGNLKVELHAPYMVSN